MFLFNFLLVDILIYVSLQSDNTAILCTDSFCKTYTTLNTCPDVPEACKVQNSTCNGIMYPYPDGPCNCCDYCIENKGLGDSCNIGSPGSPPPKSVCGNGLECVREETGAVCEIMSTPCTIKRKDWDDRKENGTLGHMEVRPECDGRGKFKPFLCIPGQTCFCLSEDGERIFGEVSFNPHLEGRMNCKCSRSVQTANKILNENKFSFMRPKCLPDGSFDPLQCLKSKCTCVDSNDGHPSASQESVIVNLISSDTLSCFDKKIHTKGEYLRPCEQDFRKVVDMVEYYTNEGYELVGTVFPNCQLDGRYAPVQEDDDNKFCVDPDNNILNNRKNDEYKVKKSDALAKTMNCKCARAASIMTGKEKPDCCPNGNYNAVQCRRGLCRCVDLDGLQIAKEVDISDKNKLSCYNQCT